MAINRTVVKIRINRTLVRIGKALRDFNEGNIVFNTNNPYADIILNKAQELSNEIVRKNEQLLFHKKGNCGRRR